MKPYFCQNLNRNWRRFDDIADARKWLGENGGGTIKTHLPPEKITSFDATRRMIVVETVKARGNRVQTMSKFTVIAERNRK